MFFVENSSLFNSTINNTKKSIEKNKYVPVRNIIVPQYVLPIYRATLINKKHKATPSIILNFLFLYTFIINYLLNMKLINVIAVENGFLFWLPTNNYCSYSCQNHSLPHISCTTWRIKKWAYLNL